MTLDSSLLAGWISTIALQGTLLLAAAWIIDRTLSRANAQWRELSWRIALFGGVLVATLQLLFAPDLSSPRFVVPTPSFNTRAVSPVREKAQDITQTNVVADAQTIKSSSVDTAGHSSSPSHFSTIDWRSGVVALWLLGAAASLMNIATSVVRLRRRIGKARSLADPALASKSHLVAQRIGVAAPALMELRDIESPLALTRGRVIVPTWALETLDHDQLSVMLAHEIAHIARRDPLWKLLTALWCSVFWFIPFAWIARRRLDDLAEIACDAIAAHHTRNHRALAECLVACAEHRPSRFVTSLAPAMASRPSSLLYRVERLLEGRPLQTGPAPGYRIVAVMTMMLCVVALPAVGFDRATAAPKGDSKSSSSVSIHSDDGVENTRIILDDGTTSMSVTIDGKIAFKADDTGIERLDADGVARFEETRDSTTRRVVFTMQKGVLQPTYFVANVEQPFDAAAQSWFAQLLPALIRESGIGAEERIGRLYRQGGAALVLDEIRKTHSTYARGLYLAQLLATGPLQPADVDAVIALAGAMESDYDRRNALTEIWKTQTLDESQQTTFLRQMQRFTSDYERSELLIAVLPALKHTEASYRIWLDAANEIGSDYEHRRCLQTLIEHGEASDADLARVIDASNSLGSDYEHRELLTTAIEHARDIKPLAMAYTQSAGQIRSDYERREALIAFANHGSLDAASARAVLDAAAQIRSKNERKDVLIALARVMPKDAALAARYHEVTADLSDFERQEAESALR